jgi:hypothetical protein
MARKLVEIGVLRLMTTPAHLDLRRRLVTHRILDGVQRMATGTRHVVRRMRARRPIVRGIRLVTGQALRVLFGCGGLRLPAEIHHSLQRPAACVRVHATRSVAGLALQATMAEGAARIIRTSVYRAKDVGDLGLCMTAQAGVRSRVAVVRSGGRSGRLSRFSRCFSGCRGGRFGGRGRLRSGRRCRRRRCGGRWRCGRWRCRRGRLICGQGSDEAGHQQHGRNDREVAPNRRHSIARRDVVHHLDIGNATRPMTNGASLVVRRNGAWNRPSLCILPDDG